MFPTPISHPLLPEVNLHVLIFLCREFFSRLLEDQLQVNRITNFFSENPFHISLILACYICSVLLLW